MPVGTRGGKLIHHYFPVDGEYTIKPRLWKNTVDQIGGLENVEQLEVAVDGQRVRLATFGGPEDESRDFDVPRTTSDEIERRFAVTVPLTAGEHAITVAFIKKSSATAVGLLRPFERDRIDPVSQVGPVQVERVSIEGPARVTGATGSPSRRKIFVCSATTTVAAATTELSIDLGERSYAIRIGSGLLDEPASWQGLPKARSAFIISNDTVDPLYADRLQAALAPLYAQVHRVSLPDGEVYKDWATLNRIFDALLAGEADRGRAVGGVPDRRGAEREQHGTHLRRCGERQHRDDRR